MPPSQGVAWRWTTEPLSERAIRNAERALGVEFPADYRACVRENHGGAPEPAGFQVDLAPGRRISGRVGLLLSLDPRLDENVLAATEGGLASGRLPGGLIPIIDDGEGRFICLDYRGDPARKDPSVAYLADGLEAFTLADGFASFLALLGTAPDAA